MLEDRVLLSTLGTTSLVEAPTAGSDSDLVVASGAWTASTNSSWITLNTTSGTGNGSVNFSFAANTGATRSDTVTIGGQTLTVTQAGAGYVAATSTTLFAPVVNVPQGVAVDSSGNVYVADFYHATIKEWHAATGTVTTVVSGGGLAEPNAVALDGAGNVYIADYNTIKEWHVATGTLTTLVATGLNNPYGLAVDGSGNVYIADTYNNAIKEWNAAAGTVTTLVSAGLSYPHGVAVDAFGNVYIADTGNNAIKEWHAATNTVTTAVSTGLNTPLAVAVNSSGNVYIADTYNNAIKVWHPATGTITTSTSGGLGYLNGLAVDASGNAFIASSGNNTIYEWQPSTGAVTAIITSLLAPSPSGSAVDSSGNVYIADTNNGAIKELNATTGAVTTLVSSGLNGASGLAVDGLGNVYIADRYNRAIKEWNAATGAVTTLVSTGLSNPRGVAVDSLGNVYIADGTIKEWNAGTLTVTTIVSAGLNGASGVALDSAGNVYIADSGNNAIKEWNATTATVTTLVSSGLNSPNGVAVDGSGNVYIADSNNYAIDEWHIATNAVSKLFTAGSPNNVAVDGSGNVYIADTGNGGLVTLPRAYVNTNAKSEPIGAGNDQLGVAISSTPILTGALSPTSDQSWLTIGSVASGVENFSFSANQGVARSANITLLGQTITVTQPGFPAGTLGTTSLVESSSAGSDSDTVFAPASWTASTTASWITVSTANGTGNGAVNFSYTANTGPTRSGTVSIAGKTLTLTQAGAGYVVASPATLATAGLNGPNSVALDSAGNIYFADTGNNAIKEWNAANGTVTTLVSAGLNSPAGVAVDSAGNVYIADTGNNAIKEWNATFKTVSTLVSTGLNSPVGVAVDGSKNVYIADANNNAIEEWMVSTTTVTTLVSTGLNVPQAVAVDGFGNVYIADTGNNAIKEWNAATTAVTTLVAAGLNGPKGVAVDSSGNVYFADSSNKAIKEWNAASAAVTTLVAAGLNNPNGVTVDGSGNVYVADTLNNAIKEFPRAYVNPSPVTETSLAGNDQLRIVTSNSNLTGVFSPTSNQSWLTFGSVANGIVNFNFSANLTGVSRTANITLLGQTIAVTQAAALATLLTTSLVAGPSAGSHSHSVFVAGSWTASTTTSWITVNTANGSGNGAVNFSFTADTGATRVGTITIAGQTLTVTQAGVGYVAAAPTILVPAVLAAPSATAVDGAGNVYIADHNNSVIKEWHAATGTTTTLVSTGLNLPTGVAVDGAGNVYIADTANNAIKEWNAATGTVTTLVSTGLNAPERLAVDGAGNVYIADTVNNAIKEWHSATQTVTTLVSTGLNNPRGVAVDSSGNVYIADTGNKAIKEWRTATGTVTTLVGLGLIAPLSVAVDGSGNVYFVDGTVVSEWHLGTQTVTTLVSTGLSIASGVAVDGSGNVYISDRGNNAIKEWKQSTSSVTTLVSSVLAFPNGLSLDKSGNVYIADINNNAIKEWQVSTGTVKTIVSTGLNLPTGVAVDSSGNVYIASNSGTAGLQEWTPATGTLTTASGLTFNSPKGVAVDSSGNVYIANTLFSTIYEWIPSSNATLNLGWAGLKNPAGIAVDGSGNIYVADTGNNAIKEWNAATHAVTTLVSTGLNAPFGVAVDSAGNVYIADSGNNAIKEWNAASGTVATLASTGLGNPRGVAVDGAGNVYVANTDKSVLEVLPQLAYVNTTAKLEASGAGTDQLSVVLPTTANLSGIFAPTSDQSWLTIGSVVNGVVNFSFSANPAGSTARTAYITLLGQTIAVTQPAVPVTLGTTSLVEGPSAGSDSDTVVTTGAWTVSTTASWITLNTTSGAGNGPVNFSFAANTGATRTGTVMIAGQTLTITQAGAGYVAAGSMPVITGLSGPYGVAVDTSGNVYASDSGHNAIKKWNASTGLVTTLVSTGLNNPFELAVDGSGNVYIADQSNNAIKEWNAATGTVTSLVSTGLNYPDGVAVDTSGNVYIADSLNGALKEWQVATGTVTTLATGLHPVGVAVDSSGNVYIADGGNNAIKEWHAATGTVTTLVTGLSNPWGVAVDGSGNVYIADGGNVLVKEWQAATGTVITLPFTGLAGPSNVAVDSSGNVYTSDWGNNAIEKLPRAYVNTTPVTEPSGAGSDQLGIVVPSTANLTGVFAPTSDQSWLTIGSVANGVVNFNFSPNPTAGVSRMAHITLLGQTIAVTQTASPIVTIPTISTIANTSAVLGGNVTSDGGQTITERGVLYALSSVNANPKLGGTGVTKVTATGTTGVFTATASGLTQGSVYSFVAYATNGNGTTYSPLGATFVPGSVNVTGVYDPSSNAIAAGATLTASTNSLSVSFSENMNSVSGGANSVTNPSNWLLFRYGVDVSYLITGITFAQNPTSLQYLATLSFAAPLNQGGYQLIARQTIQDISGRSLSGSSGTTANDFRLNFYVAQKVGATTDIAPYLYNIEPSVLNATATQTVPISSSLYVFDADSNNWTSATVQIGINYQNGEDVLGFTNTTTPNITASWNAATGTLTLTGTDTVSNYRTALHNVTYTDTSATPNTALTRTIYFQTNDGTLLSNVQTRDVTVTASSTPAVLSGVSGTGTYYQGYPAIFLAPYLVITDPNVVNLSSATVSFTNWQGEDRLIFNNIFADQWTFTQDLAAHTATFTITSADMVDHYQTLLRSVLYWDVSGAPNTSARVASFSVTDGFSTSNIVTRNTIVSAVNQPPTLTSIESTPLACKANDPAYPVQPISNTLLVGDPDSNNLTKATVQITSGYENDANGTDVLAFTNQLGITGSFNAATGTLTLTGTSSVSNYRTALRSVTFGTSGPSPSTATRTLTIYATDDYTPTPATSLSATRTVTVQVTNLPPALSNIPNAPLAYVRNAAATAIAPGAVIYDPDSINLASATIQITGNYQTGLDVLAVTVVSGITQSFDATTGTLTLSGISSLANYQTVLQSVTFYTTTVANTLSRTISLTLNDGLGNSSTVSRGVTLS